MKPVITKFNDKTGDFEITIPVPFTLKDGIEYADMIVVDIPKYEDTKDYNVFDLIRENQELKKQLHEASIEIQHLIEQDIDCPSSCNKLEELKELDLWVDSSYKIEQIIVDDYNIVLITNNAEVKVNDFVEKEADFNVKD